MPRPVTFTLVYLKLLAITTLVALIVLSPLSTWNQPAAIALWVVMAVCLVPVAWRFDDAVRGDDTSTFNNPR